MAKRALFSTAMVVVVLTCSVAYSQSQIMLNGIADDTRSCESTCESAYNNQVPELTGCKKGCRLMTIVDFMEEEATLDQLRLDCQKTCLEAYGSETNASACAFGCQSQLPAIETRRKQLKSFYDEEAPYLNPLVPVHAYFGQMMDCLMDHFRHEMTLAVMFVSASGNHRQVVVVHAQPIVDPLPEYKTSNYVETNLVLADSGATPDVKRSQMMAAAASSDAEFLVSDRRRRVDGATADWLSCFAARVGLSRMSLVFVLVMVLIGILWLFISSMTTSSAKAASSGIPAQKLSIYGDGDFLIPMDEKVQFTYIKPQEPSVTAPPLPVKIMIQEI